ncbi:hypothetical protein SAMN04489806_0770 [Paramicrobacterium humi]|uniref:Uncharacterized protein n=1 Tax=Paramicrobacterium humi TaxID=640635 RepID=A0A1H4JN82_9MICO|nr:hypothetical protein [Microbacterium humi]SEB47415.1 hypothetical protein SAMN04489806_0770 [Microbacterium humi]
MSGNEQPRDASDHEHQGWQPVPPPVNPPPAYGMPPSPRSVSPQQASVRSALAVAAFPLAFGATTTIIGAIVTGIYGPPILTIVIGLAATVAFVLGAFLSLTFIRPLPSAAPVASEVAPLAAAGALGAALLLVVQLAWMTIMGLWRYGAASSIVAAIVSALLFSFVLALGALVHRAHRRPAELRAGVPAPPETGALALNAVLIALVGIGAAAVLTAFGVVLSASGIIAAVALVVRAVIFSAVALVGLILLKPLSRATGYKDVVMSAAIGGGLGTIALLVVDVIVAVVQFVPASFLLYTLSGAISDGIMYTGVLAAAVFAVMFWRAERGTAARRTPDVPPHGAPNPLQP